MTTFESTIEPRCRLLYKRLPNGTSEGCHMDVYTPPTPRADYTHPVAIFIHGGAFTQGSSKDVAANQIAFLASHDVISVSIEYRLAPHASLRDIRADLCDAYMYIQEHLESDLAQRGYEYKLRKDRCMVTGGSAGGTSSIFLASDIDTMRREHPTLPPLRAVIPAFPLVDWEVEGSNSKPRSALKSEWVGREEWSTIKKLFEEPVSCSDPYPADVFNPDLSQPRLMFIRAAFESKTLNSFVIGHDLPYPKEASIMGGITSTFPPTRVFCAVKDSLIPVEQSYHLIRHLQSLGVDAKAVIVEEAEHGFTDLPVAYFPDHAERWWAESIRSTLEWGLEKLQ